MTAAGVAADALHAAGHTVTTVIADPSSAGQVKSFPAVIFASPSWEDEGKDGQPLPEVKQVVEALTTSDLTNKKVAVIALGDTSYPHFCGAADVLEAVLKDRGVTPVVPTLKIDRYYSSSDNEQKVKDWATGLAKLLST